MKHSRKASKKPITSTSRWDEAMDIINDLLRDETDSVKSQKLERIKGLLVNQGDEKQDKLMHLPLQLIRKGSKFSTAVVQKGVDVSVGAVKVSAVAVQYGVGASVGAVKSGLNMTSGAINKGFSGRIKPVGQMTDTVRYILKEFGGVNTSQDPSDDPADLARVCESSMQMAFVDEFESESAAYILPEFLALNRKSQMGVFKLLSWSTLKQWEFNIFDLVKITGGNPLLFIGWAVLGSPHSQYAMARTIGSPVELHELRGYNFVNSFLRMPPKKLCNYLRVMQSDYKDDNPYHNATHAADVVQTTHTLIQLIGGHMQTSKLEVFSILLSAVVHDVNHPGQTNCYQENARTDLALLYNDQSILENRHASHAFRVMLGDESARKSWSLSSRRLSHVNVSTTTSSDLNLLCNVSAVQLKIIRSKVIDAILHTDMSKHFAMVSSMKALAMANATESGFINLNVEDSPWKILTYMLHMADISGQAKRDPLFLLWAERCLEEFFAQGDMEMTLGLPISPNCDRRTTHVAESQFGFVQYVILPAYEVLGTLIAPHVEEHILPIIQSNLEYWRKLKDKDAPPAADGAGDNSTITSEE